MKATKASVWDLYNGAKQYKVPLFQRPYVWSRQQWEQLWADIQEQYSIRLGNDSASSARFLGSIVVVREYAKNLDKYVIIDGQQRITTISIILAVIRAFAREKGLVELYDQITGFLKNVPKSGEGQYVVIPTRVDKKALFHIFDEDYVFDQDSPIVECFDYFWWQLDRFSGLDLNTLQQVITEDLCVVYIELDEGENPNQVFEALNYRGVPLEESDLIRNFFFAHLESQEIAEAQYDQFWKPMEERLNNDQALISSFIRHFCMKEGRIIRHGEIFERIRRRYQHASSDDVRLLLRDMGRFSEYYRQILFPEQDEGESLTKKEIKKSLSRIRRIGKDTPAPFLMLLLAANDRLRRPDAPLSDEELLEILSCIESYLIRRMVCQRPVYGYEEVFEILCRGASEGSGYLTAEETRSFIASLQAPFDMPDDDEFTDHLRYSDLYHPGSDNELAYVILERLEEYFSSQPRGSDPAASYALFEDEAESRMIDHIMPESLSDKWIEHLGSDWSQVHADYVHRLGNLTITQENPAITNADFEVKKAWYALDNLMINAGMKNIRFWRRYQIDQRSGVLAAFCVKIWARCEAGEPEKTKPAVSAGTCMRQGEIPKMARPAVLTIAGSTYEVKYWYQVLEHTVKTVYEKEPQKFDRIVREYPGYFSDDPSRYKSRIGSYSYKSRFGRYQIRDMCLNIVRLVGWNEEVWCLTCE
ncbi:MAG TPA: DUF262 domain-containing protein [Methanospirillum sp.]|uniref:DUF262 domain-containing protein n=3 Tax=Methanospirillum sp. TaxID=45200 RepID=UPI002BA61B28|nr:DUF262 domain-containing protein [Methanospirillum sp.]HOJ95642.1 DUF262 domain-containing protein [Methanospirillum sp.]